MRVWLQFGVHARLCVQLLAKGVFEREGKLVKKKKKKVSICCGSSTSREGAASAKMSAKVERYGLLRRLIDPQIYSLAHVYLGSW